LIGDASGKRLGSASRLTSTRALPSSNSRSIRTSQADGPPSPLIAGVQPSGSEPSSTSGDANTLCSGAPAAGGATPAMITASKIFNMAQRCAQHSARPAPGTANNFVSAAGGAT